MENKDELPVNEPNKQKPNPKPKSEKLEKEEEEQQEITQEKVITPARKVTQKSKDQEAYHEEEMVLVDSPIRASNGTILGYEQKRVSRALAEIEISKWTEGGTGHSAWRDVKFSK